MATEVRKLDAAIRAEVDKIDRLTRATSRGRSAAAVEWIRQRSPWFEVGAAILQFVPLGLLLVVDVDKAPGFTIMIVSITIAAAMSVGTYLRTKMTGWGRWLLALILIAWGLFASSQILVYLA